jgi:hypothetical protein
MEIADNILDRLELFPGQLSLLFNPKSSMTDDTRGTEKGQFWNILEEE